MLANEGPKRKNSEKSQSVEDTSVYVKKVKLDEEILPVHMVD